MSRSLLLCIVVFFCTLCSQAAAKGNLSGHGLSLHAPLKYPENFNHFAYHNPQAPQGGTAVLHEQGSFDNFNPFILRGSAAYGVEELLYEPLAIASLDEPFALYGLLAKRMEVASDYSSVVFELQPSATFSDGSPVTAADVSYSIRTLKSEEAHPFYRFYYADIKTVEVVDRHRVKVEFSKKNRELPMIVCQVPILPEKHHQRNGFAAAAGTVPQHPIGSGPYLLADARLGKTVRYVKNTNYWGQNHPARRGTANFSEIIVKYYRDPVISLEAFKAGEFDFLPVNIAKQWARDMKGRRFEDGRLAKATFAHGNNAGMQGFVMNTRKSLFYDRRVRRALSLAFDFQWVNTSLFYGQYRRSTSYFSNSYLAAQGLPDTEELALLNSFRDELPQELFSTVPGEDLYPKETQRSRLLLASKLLEESGWRLQNGIRHNQHGKTFDFEIILVSPVFEKVMAAYVSQLRKLGIVATYRTIDQAIYAERVKSFDYDMMVAVFGQSQSPGNEQRSFWHSEAATKTGSRNYAGIRSAVVDYLVETIIYPESDKQYLAAIRALDRVLWFEYYLVPNWHLNYYRIGYASHFKMPKTLPLYYNPLQLLLSWWREDLGEQ